MARAARRRLHFFRFFINGWNNDRRGGKAGSHFELPWPMSEEIQRHNDRQRQILESSVYEDDIAPQAAQTQQPTGISRSPGQKPRVGALFVEAYAKLVGKKQLVLSPVKVLLEYANFLVRFCIRSSAYRSTSPRH
jgi:hypothetical protein